MPKKSQTKWDVVDSEIEATLTKLCRTIQDEINSEVPAQIGEMPYARQYCLEKLIQRLQEAV